MKQKQRSWYHNHPRSAREILEGMCHDRNDDIASLFKTLREHAR